MTATADTVAAARAYIEALASHDVSAVRLANGCRRVENGIPTGSSGPAIIRDLDLLRPIYAQTSTYGHFGRELPDFTWERTDRVDDLRSAAGL